MGSNNTFMNRLKISFLAVVVAFLGSGTGRAADHSALTAPVKSVYGDYLKIQASLANDSLTGVAENAEAIVKSVQGDANSLPASVATEAGTLAKASDLRSARTAFKSLSDSLIQYLADHQARAAYVEVYCPMARASWLQVSRKVNNPYFGQAMATCGEIKN